MSVRRQGFTESSATKLLGHTNFGYVPEKGRKRKERVKYTLSGRVYRRYIYNNKLKVGQYSDEEVWFCTGEKDRRTNGSFHQSNRKIVMIAALLAQL